MCKYLNLQPASFAVSCSRLARYTLNDGTAVVGDDFAGFADDGDGK